MALRPDLTIGLPLSAKLEWESAASASSFKQIAYPWQLSNLSRGPLLGVSRASSGFHLPLQCNGDPELVGVLSSDINLVRCRRTLLRISALA
jgi:hypothetical protein